MESKSPKMREACMMIGQGLSRDVWKHAKGAQNSRAQRRWEARQVAKRKRKGLL